MSAPEAESVGSVAEEAVKLFRALTVPPPAAGESTEESAHERSDHVCSTAWCPVCGMVGFVRDNPEAIASVTRSATDLARSVRDLLDTALAPQEPK